MLGLEKTNVTFRSGQKNQKSKHEHSLISVKNFQLLFWKDL